MINRSNRSANVSYTAEELLSHLINSGRINTDDVVNDLLMKERNDVLKAHPHAISQGKDGRWRTFVKDKRYKSGRKMIAKSTRKGVEDALYDFYIDHDEGERLRRMTIRELYPKWLEHKTIHTTAETYVTRIESDWKTYYENDEIIDRRIASLKRLDLDEWAHKLIRKYDMTKNAYYNVTMIMRQCLQYAVDLDIIESSPFDNVKIDGRRMFRSVHKKPDETQVYTDEEVEKIFELAWNDFYSSDRLIYRLAPLALMFQFQTGLRIGELCAVKHSDVRNGRIHISRMLRRDTNEVVEHTKSHDDRIVILTEAATDLIRIAAAYQESNGINTDFIFSTNAGPLKYREVNMLLKRYCERANILYRSSHKARKTYISSLIDAGININTIRAFVGHADERTTYYNYCFDRSPEIEKKRLLEKALKAGVNKSQAM